MSEGGSASRRAEELRAEAMAARAKAHSLEREAGAWQAGADGERRIGALLNAVPGWRVLHDLLLHPGRSATNLDHVAVGPAGVYLVDSKNWSGRLTLHDGTVWQHNGGHQSRRADLEQVARAAAEMERALGVPVTPLIALAGSAGADLEPCRPQGVDVVPAALLHKWFSGQPASINAAQVDALVHRVAVAFPPASPDDTPLRVARASIGSTGTPSRRSRGRRRRMRPHPIRGPFLKLMFALTLLAFAPSVLPWVAGQVAQRIEHSLRPDGQPTTPPPACAIVEKQVAVLLGGQFRTDPYRVPGQCRWFTGSRHGGVTDVTINLSTRLDGKPIRSAQAGSAVVLVPEGASLREWKNSKLVAPQHISIRMRYAYPQKATRAQRDKADSKALRQVIALSETLGGALPRLRDGEQLTRTLSAEAAKWRHRSLH